MNPPRSEPRKASRYQQLKERNNGVLELIITVKEFEILNKVENLEIKYINKRLAINTHSRMFHSLA
jgi:hypothetical protein